MNNEIYNKVNFPRFICNNGNWDIYANENGHCAAIATNEARQNGCKDSHFGDARYVKATLGIAI